MDRVKIKVTKREERGKGHAGRLRKTGAIPAVVYSEKVNIALSVPIDSLKVLRSLHFSESAIVDMRIDGDEKMKSMPVLIKDVQFNPLTEAVSHIDFFKVDLKEKIKVHIPIVLKGEAKGLKEEEGGVLNQSLRELEVEGLPLDIPEHIDVDVAELTIGHSIHAEHIALPEGIKMITDPQETIASLVAKTEEVEEEVVVDEEAPQEPELIKKEGETEPEEGKESKEAKEDKKE